jgi:zinc/manganese transport system substrate-binding protein
MRMGDSRGWARGAVVLVALAAAVQGAEAAGGRRLVVAATEPDIAAIVRSVGGDRVEVFSLFSGCIIRKDLQVEAPVRDRLKAADVVVWTGFLPESAAISSVLAPASGAQAAGAGPRWIDVSKGAARVSVPVSSCEGYIDMDFQQGNPFFWLNPRNAGVIARNVAEGLAALDPDRAAGFLDSAKAFGDDAERRIAGWQAALAPLDGVVIFSTQCGWHNFAQIGGPTFVVCKSTPGQLPSPATLVDYLNEKRVEMVLVDPHTPIEYSLAFRNTTAAKVVEVPSSIEGIKGAGSYFDLFDNLVKTLVAAKSS